MKQELLPLIQSLAARQSSPQAPMQELLTVLSERERVVLELRGGLTGERAYTLQAVVERFGVTGERVRQIEARALGKLRRTALARSRQAQPPGG